MTACTVSGLASWAAAYCARTRVLDPMTPMTNNASTADRQRTALPPVRFFATARAANTRWSGSWINCDCQLSAISHKTGDGLTLEKVTKVTKMLRLRGGDRSLRVGGEIPPFVRMTPEEDRRGREGSAAERGAGSGVR